MYRQEFSADPGGVKFRFSHYSARIFSWSRVMTVSKKCIAIGPCFPAQAIDGNL